MEQLCAALWILIESCTVYAGRIVSKLVEIWPWWQRWYTPLPDLVKTIIFCGMAAAVGILPGLAGVYLLHCANWPAFAAIAILVANAIISAISGLLRYKDAKLQEARNS